MNQDSSPGLARLKLIALMFLLPLAMALAGGYELHRARGLAAELNADSPQVQAEIAELQEMQRRVMRDMRTTIRIGDRTYAYGAAHSILQGQIDRLSGNSWRYQQAGPGIIMAFAIAAVAGGLGAMLFGVGGLAWATVAGRLARKSRDELVRVFTLSRQLLPFLLIGVVLCLVLALAGLTGAEGWRVVDKIASGGRPGGEMRLYVIVITVAVMSLWAGGTALFNLRRMFTAFQVMPLYQHGRAVTADDAPGLWRHVESVAKVVRARPPQNIVVGLTEGFYATAHDVVLLPGEHTLSGETLYVPLTHAALLRPDEFAAIVGHELGHFVGEDTEYTRRFVPMFSGMVHSLDALQAHPHWSVTPARLLGDYLLEQIAHARMHWSREREFAADAVGMHVAGSRASARALVRSSAVSAITDDFLTVALQPENPSAPADLVDGVVAHAVKHGLALPDGALDHALPHPTDSHPPTVQRLQALGEAADEKLIAEAMAPMDRRGLDLLQTFFTDRRALTAQLSAEFVGAPRDAQIAELKRLAEAGEPAADVHERTGPMLAVLGFATLAFTGIAVFLAARPVLMSADAKSMRIAAAVLAVPALALAGMTFWYWLRGRRPLFRLTPTGFDAPGLAAEVPWKDVSHVYVAHGSGCLLELTFHLKAPVPVLQNGNLRRMRWKPKPRKLAVQFIGARGISGDALLERVMRYCDAERARRELAAL